MIISHYETTLYLKNTEHTQKSQSLILYSNIKNKRTTKRWSSYSWYGYLHKLLCDNNCWYTGRDSNPQPSEPESDALSIEPPVHCLKA